MNKYEKDLNAIEVTMLNQCEAEYQCIVSRFISIRELVERAIPKKVIIHEDESAFECSNCIKQGITDSMWLFTEIGEYTYCPRCGHRLSWENKK